MTYGRCQEPSYLSGSIMSTPAHAPSTSSGDSSDVRNDAPKTDVKTKIDDHGSGKKPKEFGDIEDVSDELLRSREPIIDPETVSYSNNSNDTGKLMSKRKRKRVLRWRDQRAKRPQKRKEYRERKKKRKREEREQREEREKEMLAEGKITEEELKELRQKKKEQETLRNRSR
eukprot:jgi/Bigna1/86819/estExt_fgenesh1_pg.C_140072